MLIVAVRRIVDACIRHAAWVLLISAILAASACAYTVRHFSINTDSTSLFSAKLPWRERELAFDAAFPQRANTIVIVVDGVTAEVAEQAAANLAEALALRRDIFSHVQRPDGGPFFLHNAL